MLHVIIQMYGGAGEGEYVPLDLKNEEAQVYKTKKKKMYYQEPHAWIRSTAFPERLLIITWTGNAH